MTAIPLIVGCLADEGLAHILLANEPVTIIPSWTTSGAISRATSMLSTRLPLTLLLGLRHLKTEQEKDCEQALTHRQVLEAATMKYFIAFADPHPLSWVLTDAKLRRAFESSPQDMKTYQDRAKRVVELAASIPFDRATLLEQSEDYRGLLAFIHKHASVPASSKAG